MMAKIRKDFLTIFALVLTLGAIGLPAAAAPVVTAIVTDPLTGVAIDGFDPVSYFADDAPQKGRPDFEYDWSGVTWYFANAANRDVFIAAPEVYAPQYGGYCTMALARGYLSRGNPGIYLVSGGRLRLFYSAANREAFNLSAAEAEQKAAKNWPRLSERLSH